MSIRLLVDISGHGFGHLMQTLPVLGALNSCGDDIDCIIRSNLNTTSLRAESISFGDFSIALEPPVNAFPIMEDAFTVDVMGTAKKCRCLFRNRHDIISREADFLRKHRINAVLSNICPFSLAAAKRIGIPAIAMCSLNWAEVLRDISGLQALRSDIITFFDEIYRSCDSFIMPEPHIDASDLPNLRSIGHIARIGRDRHLELLKAIGAPESASLIVVSSGGMSGFPFQIEIPRLKGVAWVLPHDLYQKDIDRVSFHQIESIPFIDIVASADVVVMKPGYGLIAEAVTNGVRIVAIERNNWVDVASLQDWARKEGSFELLTKADFVSGQWIKKLLVRVNTPAPIPHQSKGAQEAARIIKKILHK